MQRTLLLLLALLGNLAVFSQDSQSSVYFLTAKHYLTSEAQQTLNALIPQLQDQYDFVIEVQAHTDDRGTEVYNQALAERRANAVKKYLTSKGVEVEKVSTASFGEENPTYSNEEESGRQLNRRVDVLLKPYAPKDVDDLISRMGRSHKSESFQIDGSKNIRLISSTGTSVYIDQGTFVDASGKPVRGNIDIEIKEAYDKLDMILSGVTTMAGDRLLETGGMVEVQASWNGEPLQMQEGKDIAIGIPVEEQRKKGMQLFMGQHDDNGTAVDWTPTRQAAARSASGLTFNNQKPKAPTYDFYFARYQKPKFEEPIKPNEVRDLRAPKKPDINRIKLKLKFFQRIFMSNAKKNARKKQIYERRMRSYTKRKAIYDKHMAAKELYSKDSTAYIKAVADWKQAYVDHKEAYKASYVAAKEAYDIRHEERQKQYELNLEAWKEDVEAFEAKYEKQGNIDQAGLESYFFSVNGMGWINCDRFLYIPPEKRRELAVEDPAGGDEQIYVIFTKTNSIIRLNRKKEQYYMAGLPDGMPVKLVGIRVADGQPALAVKETKIGQEESFVLNFAASSLPEIRNTLTAL